MTDIRKNILCEYCGASFQVKYSGEDFNHPEYCCFCSESFDDPTEVEDVEDDDDSDYADDDKDIHEY
jgi:hypothetical protein